MTDLGFQHHDHTHCKSEGIELAAQYCEQNKLQFTQLRRRVLEILLEQHRALGAYAILEELRHDGHAAQPPVAYRALDFLIKHGFAHKIERLNAFVACTHHLSHDMERHTPVFLICTKCDRVSETLSDEPVRRLHSLARTQGFTVNRTIIEAEGVCPNCAE